MTNQKLIITFLILLSVPLYGCVSFSKKVFRKEMVNIEENNLYEINGYYSVNPIKEYYSLNKDEPDRKVPDSSMRINGYYFLTGENYTKQHEFDSLNKNNNTYFLGLNLENKERLSVKLIENSHIIRDTIFNGRYKNGMFYIDNEYLNCDGIPYLFGGCTNNKRRIGLTKKGNLLINEAVSNDGALLLFFWTGYEYNVTYEYERK